MNDVNKKRVNDWILIAKDALKECGIAQNGRIDNNFRGNISNFGAAVIMGSLPSAVAFFSDQGDAMSERQKLIEAIHYCITEGKERKTALEVLQYVCENNSYELKEKVTDASIALKLAMSFYNCDRKDYADEESESTVQ